MFGKYLSLPFIVFMCPSCSLASVSSYTVIVSTYRNPWPWTDVLDKISAHYGLAGDYTRDNVDVFVTVFDKIDTDGGGSLDQEEMFEALHDAGLDITEEGVITLVNMIDEDGNGKLIREYLNVPHDQQSLMSHELDSLFTR